MDWSVFLRVSSSDKFSVSSKSFATTVFSIVSLLSYSIFRNCFIQASGDTVRVSSFTVFSFRSLLICLQTSWLRSGINAFISLISSFLSYFEKLAHMSVVWAYVSLWLCMFGCLLQEPIRLKVPWVGCLGTNEILASIKHGIVKDQTRALWDCHIDSSQFFHLLLRLQVFRSITLNIVMIQTLCTVMQLFKGSYLF